MKTYCITSRDKEYSNWAKKCIKSAKQYNIDVEIFESIATEDLNSVALNNNTFLKYSSSNSKRVTDYDKRQCPIRRISNGLSHFLLYRKAVENNESICILEADAKVIGNLPEPIADGVIQISSHVADQMTGEALFFSGRSRRFQLAEPQKYEIWAENYDWECCGNEGIIKHPLTGTNGTSGYIIGYKAAAKLVDYFSKDGIGFADRVREDHIGKGNLYLQVPQSVIVPRHGYANNTNSKKTKSHKLKSFFKKIFNTC